MGNTADGCGASGSKGRDAAEHALGQSASKIVAPTEISETELVLESPLGRACADEHIVLWFVSPELMATAVWGALVEADFNLLIRFTSKMMDFDWKRASFIDARRVSNLGSNSFDSYHDFFVGRQAELSRIYSRRAVTYSNSLVKSVMKGTENLGGGIETECFEDNAEALAWLGFEEQAPVIEAGLEELVSLAMGRSSVVRALRETLAESPQVDLGEVCAKLGVSARSLQRELRRLGTNFRTEQRTARLKKSQELLTETDLKLYAIAVEVGFRKVSNFIDAFRRQHGMTPNEWRQRGTAKR